MKKNDKKNLNFLFFILEIIRYTNLEKWLFSFLDNWLSFKISYCKWKLVHWLSLKTNSRNGQKRPFWRPFWIPKWPPFAEKRKKKFFNSDFKYLSNDTKYLLSLVKLKIFILYPPCLPLIHNQYLVHVLTFWDKTS